MMMIEGTHITPYTQLAQLRWNVLVETQYITALHYNLQSQTTAAMYRRDNTQRIIPLK